jgi:pSer/pThr/pTyr-binding forkhead associated (FHA) protein
MPRVTITVPDRTPQPYRFQLDRRVVSLGRGSDNDIAIDCGSVSVRHAEMVRIDGGYEIRDLGSTNGTKKDGERRMTIPLRSGDVVVLGDVAFDFQLSEEELSALADEAASLAAPKQEPVEKRNIRQPGPRPVSMASAQASSGGGGFVMFLLFVVLGTSAFFVGMSMRYQKDTKKSLLEEIRKPKVVVKPAAAEETPAAPAEK